MEPTWTVIGETGETDGGSGPTAVLAREDLFGVTGWEPKAQGWCRGEECLPASLIGPVAEADVAAIEQVADALGAALATDAEHRIAVLGHRPDAGSTVASGVAPDVVLTGLDGEQHRVFERSGAKTLVVAFSSWCGCRYDLPGWNALKDELSDAAFDVVAVAIDESAEDVAPWATGVDFPVLVDVDRRFADSYGLVNVPTVIWVDEERRIVRRPTPEFADDTFVEVHGRASGEHLDAVRRWVLDDVATEADPDEAYPDRLDDDQRRARAEFRLALELLRRGHPAAAAERIATADSLAPDDFTIWRAGMQLTGQDPFGAEFFERYTDWQQRHGGPLAVES